MRNALMGIAAAAMLALLAGPAVAGDVTTAEASADVSLTVEKYLSIEIITPPAVTVSDGSSSGGGYVGFNVKFNFVPCFYIHQYELAGGMPAGWELYPGDYDVDTLDVDGDSNTTEKVGTNTWTSMPPWQYFPNGMGLGSSTILDGVTLEDAAVDYQNTVIGTCYLDFQVGEGPYGD